jgi:type 1 fimbriae regulatory protein FimB
MENRKYLTEKELKDFFQAVKEYWKTKYFILFFLTYFCAGRVTEITELKIWDFDANTWRIYIRRKKWSINKEYNLPKWFCKILKVYVFKKNKDSYMFQNCKMWKYTRQNISYFMKKFAKKAWLSSHISVHNLKHTIAVTLAEKWLDIYELKDWMWHKSIQNTMIYYHMSAKKQAEYLKKVWDFNDIK